MHEHRKKSTIHHNETGSFTADFQQMNAFAMTPHQQKHKDQTLQAPQVVPVRHPAHQNPRNQLMSSQCNFDE